MNKKSLFTKLNDVIEVVIRTFLMLTKYIILDGSHLPLETLLFNSCKYGFKFKLGSKMSPKH